MSKADELLAAIVEDGEQAYPTDTEIEPHIVIGADRSITVPDILKKIAVEHDHNIETVTFDCPRYWDGRDMLKMPVYINYRLSNGKTGAYIADNVRPDENDDSVMHFDWTISNYITQVAGYLSFLVCVKKVNVETAELVNHWNSDLCSDMYVSEGMECVPEHILPQVDIITQLLTLIPEMREAVTHVSNAETAAIAASEAAERANAAAAGAESYAEYSDYMASALTASVSGETIRVDDVSPAEHTVRVKVGGKNLIDDATCKIDTQTAKGVTVTNNGDGSYTLTGENTSGGFVTFTSSVKPVAERVTLPAGTYTSSAGCTTVIKGVITGKEINNERTFTIDEPFQIVAWYCYINPDNTVGSGAWARMPYTFAPQLEEGDTATEYEPYIDPTTVTVTRYGDDPDNATTYTPESDGTVTGIRSVAPTMTLLTDTAGATIEAEYNQDTNKVFNDLAETTFEIDDVVAEHITDMDNPHNVTPEKIGAAPASHTHDSKDIILTDRVTGAEYRLYVSDGVLGIEPRVTT